MHATPESPSFEHPYDLAWRDAQAQAAAVRAQRGLAGVLRWLARESIGLRGDTSAQPMRYQRLVPRPGRAPDFWVHVNPRRQLRPQAHGHDAAHRPADLPDNLGRDSIRVASGGRQVGVDIALGSRRRRAIIVAQAFPLAPVHCVIATASDSDLQQLDATSADEPVLGTVESLCEVALALGPGWITYFNGVGAGATQRRWHIQALEVPRTISRFPLQQASTGVDSLAGLATPFVPGYPLAALCLRGAPAPVVATGARTVAHWLAQTGPGGDGTVNLIATAIPARGASQRHSLMLWVVPRIRHTSGATPVAARLASVEIMGMMVASSESDVQRALAGAITHEEVATGLAAIEPAGVREVLGRFWSNSYPETPASPAA